MSIRHTGLWHCEHIPGRDNGREWRVADRDDHVVTDFETEAEAKTFIAAHNATQGPIRVALGEAGFRELVAGRVTKVSAADGSTVEVILLDIGWVKIRRAVLDANPPTKRGS